MSKEAYAAGDADRRIANLIRYGTISELDEANALVKVDLGDIITDWVHWAASSAGTDSAWRAPEVGEQVILFSPSGELSSGVVYGSLYQDSKPAPAAVKTVQRVKFADGTIIEYDRSAHQLKVDASASNGAMLVSVGTGTVTINCATATVNATTEIIMDTPKVTCKHDLHVIGTATIDGAATMGATLAVTGAASLSDALSVSGASTLHAVTSNGKDVGSTHKHLGVTTGGGISGFPQ